MSFLAFKKSILTATVIMAPILAFASGAGSPISGHVDNFAEAQDLRIVREISCDNGLLITHSCGSRRSTGVVKKNGKFSLGFTPPFAQVFSSNNTRFLLKGKLGEEDFSISFWSARDLDFKNISVVSVPHQSRRLKLPKLYEGEALVRSELGYNYAYFYYSLEQMSDPQASGQSVYFDLSKDLSTLELTHEVIAIEQKLENPGELWVVLDVPMETASGKLFYVKSKPFLVDARTMSLPEDVELDVFKPRPE